MENDDLKYVQEFRTGSQTAFNKLYSKYLPIAVNFFSQDDLTRDETQDHCQEIFIKLFRALQTKEIINFKSLFYKTLLNKKKDLIRHKYRHQYVIMSLFCEPCSNQQIPEEQRNLIDLLIEPNEDLPDSQVEAQELQAIVQRCLDQIQDEKRKTIIAMKLDGYKEQQIAEILEINPHTVSSNWGRGKIFLQNCIKEYFKTGFDETDCCEE